MQPPRLPVLIAALGLLIGSTGGRAGTSQVPSERPDEWKVAVTTVANGLGMEGASHRWSGPKWSPDGRLIAMRGDDGFYLFDVSAGERPRRWGDQAWEFAWSPDGSTLAYIPHISPSRARQYEVRVHDVASGETRVVATGSGPLGNLTWTREGRLLCTDGAQSSRGGPPTVRTVVSSDRPEPPGRQSYAWVNCDFQMHRSFWTGAIGEKPVAVPSLDSTIDVVAPVDGRFLATWSASGPRGCVITDREGHVRCDSLPGNFIPSDWTRDGQYLLGFEETYGPETEGVSASDLAIWDVATGRMTRLTGTPEILECWPTWCPVEPALAFVDGRTRNLMIARLSVPQR